jgi:replicative DNA helicase
VSQEAIRPSEVSLNEVMEFQIRRSVDIYEGKIKPGIETPIEKLTKSSGGWRNGELIILAARPGMGKTAFCLASALKAGKNNHPTLIFSLEMSKEHLTNRILAMESGIESQRFTHLGLDLSGLTSANEAKERLKNLPLLIDDSGSLTIEDIIIKSKRLKAKNNIELIIVDYLQLISSVGDNREQQVSKISRSLKILAKDLDVPIIALSQLSRAVETRPDRRPRLSDLRDSGAIEQDADVVIFLFRPEYYGIFKWEEYYNYAPTTNEAEYIIAKNRQAENSRGRIAFNSETVLFLDLDS